jgi:regulator of protease activity HflC (stomatin/prohibitin superfamily)
MEASAGFCLLFLLLTSLALAVSSVKFPSEHTRLVVFRLGRFVDVRGPGLVFLIPFIENAVEVDLSEQERRLSWEGTTRDRSQVVVDLVWRYQVIDPAESILKIGSLESAMKGIIGTTLHRVFLDMVRMDLGMNRRLIEVEVETELREKIQDFGTELRGVEIEDVREG